MDSIHFFVYGWLTQLQSLNKNCDWWSQNLVTLRIIHVYHLGGGGDPATAAEQVHVYLLTRIWFTDLASKSGILGSRAVETASNELRYTSVSPHSRVADH